MIEALKEAFGGLIVFGSLILLVFVWAGTCVAIQNIKNYLKK
jgi:uncharacterized protein YneF (UPF0154 family)